MKDIKHFIYKNIYEYDKFLKKYGYMKDDVNGYSTGWKEEYHGNFLKVYIIYFNDGEYKLFRVIYFKDINEYDKARLGVYNNKLLSWYDSANVRKYKVKDIYGLHDRYVITD